MSIKWLKHEFEKLWKTVKMAHWNTECLSGLRDLQNISSSLLSAAICLHNIKPSIQQSDDGPWMMLMSSHKVASEDIVAENRESNFNGEWEWHAAVFSLRQSFTFSPSVRIIAAVLQIQFHSEWLAVMWPRQTWAERLSAGAEAKTETLSLYTTTVTHCCGDKVINIPANSPITLTPT